MTILMTNFMLLNELRHETAESGETETAENKEIIARLHRCVGGECHGNA